MQTNEAIKLWKELGITGCNMEFSCGGDSMNDTTFTFYKEKEVVECQELTDYFDNEVYNEVEFYVNSDGHYQGEFGNVVITLDEDSDDEDDYSFNYVKSSQSEWSESVTNVIGITLTEKETEFINNYVSNINGGDGSVVVNFKRDFIMSDDEENLLEELENKIKDETQDYTPENVDGELDDYYTFTTNGDDELEVLTIKDNELQVEIHNSYTEIRDEN